MSSFLAHLQANDRIESATIRHPRAHHPRLQQMMRELKRSLIEIALEVGYTSPSAFAQVFRRITGVRPTEFRGAL